MIFSTTTVAGQSLGSRVGECLSTSRLAAIEDDKLYYVLIFDTFLAVGHEAVQPQSEPNLPTEIICHNLPIIIV